MNEEIGMQDKLFIEDRLSEIKRCEEVVIGLLLLDSQCWNDMSALVDERDFMFEHHRLMFHTIRLMVQEEMPVSVRTLRDQMRLSVRVGTPYWSNSYYEKLARQVTPTAYAQACINVIKNKRKPYDILANKSGIVKLNTDEGFMSETDFLPQVIEDIETAYSCQSPARLGDIFELIQAQRLIVLTGCDAQKNLVLGLALIHYCIFATEYACGVFCRTPKELVANLLAIESQLDIDKLRGANLDEEDFSNLSNAHLKLGNAPLYLSNLAMGFKSFENALYQFTSRCEKVTVSEHNSPIFVPDLSALLSSGEDEVDIEKALSRLQKSARATRFPIIVTCSSESAQEQAVMARYADVLMTLESSSADYNAQSKLSILIKGNDVANKMALSFNMASLTVQVQTEEVVGRSV
jgi:replicative DNA helicase